MFFVASACVSAGFAQPVAVSPRWQVNFPPAANGRPGESTAVPVNGDFDDGRSGRGGRESG